ncbi:MAG: FtsX-like permease family protein, partial [Gemmatimonadota bacterium]
GVQYAQAGMLYGIQLDSSTTPMTVIERQIREGKLSLGPTSSGYPPLLVGRGLADKLGVYAGDTVVVVSVENVKQGPMGNLMPKMMKFEVTGRFSTGMYEYDNNNLYTSLPPAQELVGLGDGVSGLAVNVQDPWKAGAVRAKLDDELGVPLWTSDWMQLNSSLFSALKLEKMALAVILFLIVLVAAFNIISTLIMVVTDKTREIGILKAMGMTAGRILRVFILQGVIIGLVGTFLGTGAGLFLVWLLGKYKFITLPGDVYFIDTLPVALQPEDLIMIVALSILIAFVATIYPAYQASRLEPVDAIRYE